MAPTPFRQGARSDDELSRDASAVLEADCDEAEAPTGSTAKSPRCGRLSASAETARVSSPATSAVADHEGHGGVPRLEWRIGRDERSDVVADEAEAFVVLVPFHAAQMRREPEHAYRATVLTASRVVAGLPEDVSHDLVDGRQNEIVKVAVVELEVRRVPLGDQLGKRQFLECSRSVTQTAGRRARSASLGAGRGARRPERA